MNLRTFSAPSMAQALVQVKNEMGSDALILHTRTYHRRRWFWLRQQEIVEITAGSGLNMAGRPTRRPSQQRTGVQQGAYGPRQRVTVTSSVSQPSRGPAPALPSAAPNPAETRRQLLESPA